VAGTELPSFWDLYASCYDAIGALIPYRAMVDEVVGLVPERPLRLLDAGCGTGNLLVALRRLRPSAELTGIDASSAMLKKARSKLDGIDLRTGDLNEKLGFPDHSFDVITSVNVLYALADPARTVAELRRVLKPGGLLILCTPRAEPDLPEIVARHLRERGLLRSFSLLLRLVPIAVFNGVILSRGRARKYWFLERSEIERLVGGATISTTYAEQDWLAYGSVEAHS
jgi:ubiquinone/menaquinone biosynthesis C-methylase UbiE